jgi:Flp pilus assembly protein TadD
MTDDLLARARQCHRADDYATVERLCRQILQAGPDHEEAWRLLGEACLFQGKFAEAAEALGRAVRLRPDLAEVHCNRGVALAQLGRLEEAVTCYRAALGLRPDDVDARNNLGVALTDLRRPDEAADQLREAVRLKPDHAEAHNSLGIALEALGKVDEAECSYREALRCRPDYANAHNNLGVVLAAQGRLDEAVAGYQRALRIDPRHAGAHNNLGAALAAQGKLDEAVAGYQRALRIDPRYASAHNNLGAARAAQGKLDEALASYRQAVRLDPDHAEAHKNLAHALLLAGDFAQGWREYEWRWRCREFPRLSYARPAWDGSPLEGRTILLCAEQGLGDTIQFVRYAALLKQRGGCVVVAPQKELLPLLAGCPGIDELAERDGPPPHDVFAPLLSLPRLLGTTLATVPAEVPYLRARPDLVERWREELRPLDGLRVGIAWQGSPRHRQDRLRSFPLSHFEPLARLPGVRLLSLQKGHGAEQLRQLAGRFPVVDLAGRLDEARGPFVDMAGALSNLDLVVTCDTSVAHLAGALAVPVWVALPFAPDWRWLRERSDSPWYPTLRLFRQEAPGAWEGVFGRMAAALNDRRS